MKTEVLNFLKNPATGVEKFNAGYQLLLKTAGVHNSQLRNYNVRGYTPQSLDTLMYDLKKLHGISDMDIHNHTVPEAEPAVSYDKAAFAKANKDVFGTILKEMNDTEKAGLKMTSQYPFLRDENCPDPFKILVADAITAYHQFTQAHTELFNKVVVPENAEISDEEIYATAAGLLGKFELNRGIHAELEHYAKTGEILGEHEIFADLRKERAVTGLSDVDLKQKIRNLGSSVSKVKQKITKTKDKTAKAELTAQLQALTEEKEALQKTFEERKNKTV